MATAPAPASDAAAPPPPASASASAPADGSAAGAGGAAPFPERDVRGRVCVVTGASKGLGAELAKQLAVRRARVVLTARSADRLAAVATSLKALPGVADTDVITLPCDVTSPAAVAKLAADVEKECGHVDVLVCNAGVMPGLGLPPTGVPDDHEATCLRTNVDGPHWCTKYFLPLLTKAPVGFERTILYVTSCEGWLTDPTDGNGLLAYRASKAAVNGLMVGVHQLYVKDGPMEQMIRGGGELALHRVVSGHPGYVCTGLGVETARMVETDITEEEHAKRKEWEDFVSVEKGVDTLVWLVCAADGAVESGKTYADRTAHTF